MTKSFIEVNGAILCVNCIVGVSLSNDKGVSFFMEGAHCISISFPDAIELTAFQNYIIARIKSIGQETDQYHEWSKIKTQFMDALSQIQA